MKRLERSALHRVVASATLAVFTACSVAGAQTPATAPPATAAPAGSNAAAAPPGAGAAADDAQNTFTQEQLDQLVAPIALYPDSLFAQVLMAATYPLDVVQADRWVKANPNMKDKALEDALQKQSWDPAVKALCPFPQVLAMMSEKLDWTQKLGDAFLGQQEDVMKTAQTLRAKAVEQGSLKDSKEQKVTTEKVESTTVIKIEPTNPEVVYVPTYNPTVVYGAWPYPAYPPYYYYPPGYVAGGALLGFTAGVIVGGALWGNCNWGGNNVNVNVNRYNNFNKANISNGNWQHNSDRRGAVPYKNQNVANKYNRGGGQGAQARDAYRGRDGGGFQQTGTRGNGSGGARAGQVDSRGGAGAGRDVGGAGGRDSSGMRNSSAFDGGSRAQTQNFSNRGSSSMNSARSSSGARSSGGGARSSGGGARGGGGGRGGRR
jgi:hypothetical protein